MLKYLKTPLYRFFTKMIVLFTVFACISYQS